MLLELEQAIAYRNARQYDDAQRAFAALYERYPDDAQVNYQYAWLCDALGEEARAVPYYEKALAGGLPDDDLRGALLGLGSTYRTLGEYQKALDTLHRGMTTFPDAREFVVFHAMALYNIGQQHAAMGALLHLLAETSSDEGITQFARAIHLYADDLDKIWR